MRKSISVAFFSLVSTLMVLGIVLMGASEWVLFKNYFAKDRYETLDQVVGVTQRTAQYLVQQAELPEGDELDALSVKCNHTSIPPAAAQNPAVCPTPAVPFPVYALHRYSQVLPHPPDMVRRSRSHGTPDLN